MLSILPFCLTPSKSHVSRSLISLFSQRACVVKWLMKIRRGDALPKAIPCPQWPKTKVRERANAWAWAREHKSACNWYITTSPMRPDAHEHKLLQSSTNQRGGRALEQFPLYPFSPTLSQIIYPWLPLFISPTSSPSSLSTSFLLSCVCWCSAWVLILGLLVLLSG